MPQPLGGLTPRRSRWSPRASPVDDRLFQGRDEPCPGHWRQNPEPWPPGLTSDDSARGQLRDALGELPPLWRAVARWRDVAGRDAAEVAAELGLAAGQEQRILNQARAALRASLSRLARRDPR
jgi:RNA polymerase sigma-70 factor, ECF subfamily